MGPPDGYVTTAHQNATVSHIVVFFIVVVAFCFVTVITEEESTLREDVSVCRIPGGKSILKKGEVLPIKGQCAEYFCDGSVVNSTGMMERLFELRCEELPDKSCKSEPGNADAEFPDCCPKITCGGIEFPHARCVDPAQDHIIRKGETWPMADGTCGVVECAGATLSPKNKKPASKFVRRTCMEMKSADESCILQPGIQGAPFPVCCPRELCMPGGEKLAALLDDDEDK